MSKRLQILGMYLVHCTLRATDKTSTKIYSFLFSFLDNQNNNIEGTYGTRAATAAAAAAAAAGSLMDLSRKSTMDCMERAMCMWRQQAGQILVNEPGNVADVAGLAMPGYSVFSLSPVTASAATAAADSPMPTSPTLCSAALAGLPLRKKSLKMCSECSSAHGVDSETGALIGCSAECESNQVKMHLAQLPDELLLFIFSYLLEKDLGRLSLVCRRFRTISNDCELWKKLYQHIYEYDYPCFRTDLSRFEFVHPADSNMSNPWKESFKHLYKGIHVRSGYAAKYRSRPNRYLGRHIHFFDSIKEALEFLDHEPDHTQFAPLPTHSASTGLTSIDANLSSSTKSTGEELEVIVPVMFIHKGVYRPDSLSIDLDVAMIGAGMLFRAWFKVLLD